MSISPTYVGVDTTGCQPFLNHFFKFGGFAPAILQQRVPNAPHSLRGFGHKYSSLIVVQQEPCKQSLAR
jgi:hypothetical protein